MLLASGSTSTNTTLSDMSFLAGQTKELLQPTPRLTVLERRLDHFRNRCLLPRHFKLPSSRINQRYDGIVIDGIQALSFGLSGTPRARQKGQKAWKTTNRMRPIQPGHSNLMQPGPRLSYNLLARIGATKPVFWGVWNRQTVNTHIRHCWLLGIGGKRKVL